MVTAATAGSLIQARTTAARNDLEQVEAQIAAVTPEAQAVDQLARRIAAVRQQEALVDSLLPAVLPASDLVRQLSAAVAELNSMWLTDLSVSECAFSVQGISLYGNRIPHLAESQEGTRIHSVALTSIMDKTLYEYDVSGPVPTARETEWPGEEEAK